MSWETRGNGQQTYYYRVKRDTNGHLVKQYFGTGPAAQRAAQEDDLKRALRKQAQSATQHVHHLESQLADLTNVVHTFVTASFLGAGFHLHTVSGGNADVSRTTTNRKELSLCQKSQYPWSRVPPMTA